MNSSPLILIPVIDAVASQEPAIEAMQAEPARLDILLTSAQRSYTKAGMRFADTRSRIWSERSASPYAGAVIQVERLIGRPGAYLLNYSYEWGCTSGAFDDPVLGGVTLLRTLDWPFDGLGRALIVTRQRGQAGPYFSVTWPGFVGVLTGSAPGRFAAAINQPPLPPHRLGKIGGWLTSRLRVNRTSASPPSHLLRLAFDSCHSFAEAVELIRATPICLPAIFTIAGPGASEAIVIERTENSAFEPAEAVASNHWTAHPGPCGRARNASSIPRRSAMFSIVSQGQNWSFDWLQPPILQRDTRLAVMANPKTGRLLVQGWEKTGAVTHTLDI